MSSNGSAFLNDSILRTVHNYKDMVSRQQLQFSAPLKRSLSEMSNSSEESNVLTPQCLKKLKVAERNIVCSGSPREFRRLKCDLLESRNYSSDLENQLIQMRTMSKEATIMYEKETNRWKSQAERDRKTILALEAKVSSYHQKANTNRIEINEMRSAYAEYKTNSDLEKQGLTRKLSTVQEEMHEQSIDDQSLVTRLQSNLEEKEMLYKAAVEETEAYKTLASDLEKKLQQQTKFENEIEMKKQALMKAHQQIKKFESAKESYQEFQEQAKSQQSKLSNYDHLDRECHRLREENFNLKSNVHNKLILEEKVHDLKGRLEKYKEQEKKLNDLIIEHTQTELSLEEFRSLARSVCEITDDSFLPGHLRKTIEKLQQQELVLTTEKIQLSTDLSMRANEAKLAKDQAEELALRSVELEKERKVTKTQLARMQRKIQLISGERDNYRKQLDSYEKDLTICMQPASTSSAAQPQTQFDRIKNLESTIDEYRDLIHKLENDLRASEGLPSAESAPIRIEQVARLQTEIVKLKNDNVTLRERKDRLEMQLEAFLVGRDDVEGRIVHAERNPMSELLQQREMEKERLEEEIMQLRRKIKKLEDGLEASRLGDVTLDAKQVIELKEQLQACEKRTSKLKEHFKNNMNELRDVIYMLFGYKMDKNQKLYKLTNLYAEHDDEVLLFDLNENGVFNLMENQYSASLEELVDTHLLKHKSIPVFLSALTMELFENSTMAKAYDVDDENDSNQEDTRIVINDEEEEEDSGDDTVEEVEEVDDDDDDEEVEN